MWQYLLAIVAFGGLMSVVVYLASKNGSKSAQLEALKAEIRKNAEEQRRANEAIDRVRNMSESDIRNRLSNIHSKQ